MEPRTPPRSSRHRGVPPTPATPRFGTFEDEPDFVHRKASSSHSLSPAAKAHNPLLPASISQSHGHHRHKRPINVPFTPKQTPKRRKDPYQSTQESSRAKQRPALRIPSALEANEIAEEDETDVCDDANDHGDVRLDLMSRFSQAPSAVKNTSQPATRAELELTEPARSSVASSASSIRHPHQPQPPPDVPGIWYVFRGKRIFRALPPDEELPQPVTLFKDDLQRIEARKAAAGGESDSDAETDVDW